MDLKPTRGDNRSEEGKGPSHHTGPFLANGHPNWLLSALQTTGTATSTLWHMVPPPVWGLPTYSPHASSNDGRPIKEHSGSGCALQAPAPA